MNFIFESSSVLKNVCLLLRRITLLLNMSRICMAGWILFMPQNYYKLFQMNLFFGIWRRKNTETLVGDLISSCYYSMEVVIVRIVVISESKSDKCDLWDTETSNTSGFKDSDHIMDGECWCRKWRKKWQRLLFTLLHRRDVAHWNSVTQGGNDNFCAFIIKLESEKF